MGKIVPRAAAILLAFRVTDRRIKWYLPGLKASYASSLKRANSPSNAAKKGV